MGAFAIFQLVVAVLAQLPTLIQAAEAIFGAVKGQGPAKKDFVLGGVKSGLQLAATFGNDAAGKPDVQAEILALSDKAIDGVVGAINTARAWRIEGSDR